MSNGINDFHEFGEFRFDSQKRILWREGEIVALAPKAADVLHYLIESRGDLVEREVLLQKVWQDTFVEEGNLNHAISALRKALGSDEIIKTVPRRGYRFAANTVKVVDSVAPELVIEKRTVSNTLIEEHEEVLDNPSPKTNPRRSHFILAAAFIALVIIAGTAWFLFYGSAGKSAGKTSIKSIAVLPLRSFSNPESDQEMRLRLTDAMITRLGTFDELVVRPTSSVLQYSNQDSGAVEAGRELGVDAVLDGRLQLEDDRLRVTVQLISVASGDQIWSGQFDGRVGEILALQDAISNRLSRDVAFVQNKNSAVRNVPNNDAYEAYLKGRFLWNQRGRDAYFKALEYFQQSVTIDPTFALGYTGISDCYHLLQQTNEMSTIDAFERAEAAARKALELDPTLPEGNTSMGSVMFLRYFRWAEAEMFYKRAIELNPNKPEAYARLGMLYNAWSRFDEAYTVLKQAEALDPTSINNAIYLGANFYFSKQFDRAANHFNRILEFAPNTARVHFFLQRIYEISGRYDLAVEHSLREREVVKPASVEPLRVAYKHFGIRGFWRKQIEILNKEAETSFDLENHIASRYVLLGENETAIRYIEKNLNNLGTMRNYGAVDPIFDPLREIAGYQKLMKEFEPAV